MTTGARSGGSWWTTCWTSWSRPRADSTFRACSREAARLPAVADLSGRRRTRTHRGGGRQRRRRRRDVRVRRGAVRLPHPLPDGAHHGGLRHRAGDGGPALRVHRQGIGRAHPRRVAPAPHRVRHHGLRHRQPRSHGHRIRWHRHLVRALRCFALPLGADRRGGDLVARPLRLVPLRRAGVPAPHARLHHLSDRRRPGPSELAPGGGQHGVAPLRRQQVVPPPLGRPHRHHHHPVHPALRGGCRRRQGGQARGVSIPAV